MREDVEQMTAEAEAELDHIDGFVDIVGMPRWGDLFDLTDEDLSWQFDIVLRHAFLAAQLCGRLAWRCRKDRRDARIEAKIS